MAKENGRLGANVLLDQRFILRRSSPLKCLWVQ